MASKQKAIVVGNNKDLVVGTVELQEPGTGQIRIKVKAVSVNPADWKLANVLPAGKVVGLDAAGVIEKLGDEVKDWKVGDRVLLCAPNFNVFSEYYVTESHMVAQVPDELSFGDAAALPCCAMTAYVSLHDKLRYQHGQSILITAGAGGVGGYATQMASHHGLKVIATTSGKNMEAVKKLGATHVIDYTKSKDIVAEVKEINGGMGVDLALDCVGGAQADIALAALINEGGELAAIAGVPSKPITEFGVAKSVHKIDAGYQMRNKRFHKQQVEFNEHLAHIAKRVARKQFDARVVSTLKGWEDVPKAAAIIKEGHTAGKIVVLVDPDQGVVKSWVPPEYKKPQEDQAKAKK